MRAVGDKNQFTPFGIWIREYLRSSGDGLAVTNLDYVIEDFKNKKIMLLEEKQSGGTLHPAQRLTFKVIDAWLRSSCPASGYDYWGFYVLKFPCGATMPGPGMTLNGAPITCEQLKAHCDFTKKACESLNLSVVSQAA